MEQKKLTIVIPTYNRRERLIRQLDSLINQIGFERTNIIISDNCSDYDVNEVIISHLGGSLANVEVVRNKYNILANGNMAQTFLLCKTQWMWMLGDDDETTSDSIQTVLSDIDTFSDVSMLKYSITGFKPHSDVQITSIKGLLDYYQNEQHTSGDLIFMSNNVFNLKIISPYIGQSISHSYTSVIQLLPILFSFDNEVGIMQFCSKAIVTYLAPAPSTGWRLLDCCKGLSTVYHIPFKSINDKELYRLMSLLAGGFNFYEITRQTMEMDNKEQGYNIFKTLYFTIYKNSPIKYRSIIYWMYYIQMTFHISLLRMLLH